MSDIPSILNDAQYRHLSLQKLESIAGFNIPAYNKAELSNYVAADKPQNIVLKQNGVQVAALTLSYDGSNNLTSIVRS
jgi:hypothetical protein